MLRHTSGIAYEITGAGMVQRMYAKAKTFSRDITSEEHAKLIASMPLMCQPGTEWNYSRSTDILGRVIEVVSGKTLGAYLNERILSPLQMNETGFSTPQGNASRIAQPFAADPWTGDKVAVCSIRWKFRRWNPAAADWSRPRWTTRAFARCCSAAGTLDGHPYYRPH